MEQAHNNIDVTLVCPGPVYSKIAEEAFTGKADKVAFLFIRCVLLCLFSRSLETVETWRSDAIERQPDDDGAMFGADDARDC